MTPQQRFAFENPCLNETKALDSRFCKLYTESFDGVRKDILVSLIVNATGSEPFWECNISFFEKFPPSLIKYSDWFPDFKKRARELAMEALHVVGCSFNYGSHINVSSVTYNRYFTADEILGVKEFTRPDILDCGGF